MNKLAHRWKGPYVVLRRMSNGGYPGVTYRSRIQGVQAHENGLFIITDWNPTKGLFQLPPLSDRNLLSGALPFALPPLHMCLMVLRNRPHLLLSGVLLNAVFHPLLLTHPPPLLPSLPHPPLPLVAPQAPLHLSHSLRNLWASCPPVAAIWSVHLNTETLSLNGLWLHLDTPLTCFVSCYWGCGDML